jgi:hypothetical protein
MWAVKLGKDDKYRISPSSCSCGLGFRAFRRHQQRRHQEDAHCSPLPPSLSARAPLRRRLLDVQCRVVRKNIRRLRFDAGEMTQEQLGELAG